jgi:hypothetical protein
LEELIDGVFDFLLFLLVFGHKFFDFFHESLTEGLEQFGNLCFAVFFNGCDLLVDIFNKLIFHWFGKFFIVLDLFLLGIELLDFGLIFGLDRLEFCEIEGVEFLFDLFLRYVEFVVRIAHSGSI